ncbi:MAG: retropepsin-like aspartic protease [Pyrinomonadaceae bacterium]
MKAHKDSVFKLLALSVIMMFVCAPSFGNGLKGRDAQQSRVSKGARALKIPFEISDGGHIFLSVRVNGSEPVWFGLDSGAEQTMIGQSAAAALRLKVRGGMQAAGGGEELVDFGIARNVSFGLQDFKFVLSEVGVLPLEFSSSIPGQKIAGLLGYDFISRFVVEIDYASHVINLHSPRGYIYRGRGDSVPVKMIDGNPHILARVALPGLAPVAGMFVLDSGANTDIFFYSPFVKTHKLLESTQQTTEAATEGIGGESKIRIGGATNVQIGRTWIANPVVHFSLAEKGDSASTIGAGFIGGKLLSRFKTVIFDQSRRRIIFEPKESL